MSIISCDGCATYTALKDEYPTIKETETPFIILSGGLKYKSYYQKMYDSGYNAYFLKVTNSQKYEHSQLNKDMIDYLLRYAVGEQDEIPENENGYILYKGNFENGVDIENIRCASAGNLAGYDKNKYKSNCIISPAYTRLESEHIHAAYPNKINMYQTSRFHLE